QLEDKGPLLTHWSGDSNRAVHWACAGSGCALKLLPSLQKRVKGGRRGLQRLEVFPRGHGECQKNTDSKAGQMEVEAALIHFARSWERQDLRYTTMLSDGDSRSFTALQEANVYGFVPVKKKDCVNHVQKRMGTALRSLVQKQKGAAGPSLGGKGRLS
ncbi:unnamed protein product, partial [Ixodes pacificus]